MICNRRVALGRLAGTRSKEYEPRRERRVLQSAALVQRSPRSGLLDVDTRWTSLVLPVSTTREVRDGDAAGGADPGDGSVADPATIITSRRSPRPVRVARIGGAAICAPSYYCLVPAYLVPRVLSMKP